jgi:two component regulator with propeller domain
MYKKSVTFLMIVVSIPTTGCYQTQSITESTSEAKAEGSVAGHKILRIFASDQKDGNRDMRLPAPQVILQLKSGVIWFIWREIVYRFDEGRDRWIEGPYLPSRELGRGLVRAMCESSDGKVWVLGESVKGPNELLYFDEDRWHQPGEISHFLDKAVPNALFRGSKASIWIATDLGLLTYDGNRWSKPSLPPTIIERDYQQIVRAYDGRTSGGLSNQPSSGLLKQINCGAEDTDGLVWLGAEKALVSVDPRANRWMINKLPALLTTADRMYIDRTRRIWVSDDAGHVAVFDRRNWTVHQVAERDSSSTRWDQFFFIHDIYQDTSHQMLLATEEGLMVFLQRTQSFRPIVPTTSGLPTELISAIMEDQQGRIWLGTGSGIVVLGP